eukprot:TRINITY_DN22649_c0_g1_i1.p1 TRINITY_DN22649_c0_g1~~TRINITY_DN22649_c0_g1_i1.p1  ORF type:complete len:246 (+),score=77.95 TRINITY_DN22649_c0_g1_i1:54-740(+)
MLSAIRTVARASPASCCTSLGRTGALDSTTVRAPITLHLLSRRSASSALRPPTAADMRADPQLANSMAGRETQADGPIPKQLYDLFFGSMIRHGKRSVAHRISYKFLTELRSSAQAAGVKSVHRYFANAVKRVSVPVKLIPKKVAGRIQRVPVPQDPKREISVASRMIQESARKFRKERGMAKRVAAELDDAYAQRGNVWNKKVEIQKQAIYNRANTKLLAKIKRGGR